MLSKVGIQGLSHCNTRAREGFTEGPSIVAPAVTSPQALAAKGHRKSFAFFSKQAHSGVGISAKLVIFAEFGLATARSSDV